MAGESARTTLRFAAGPSEVAFSSAGNTPKVGDVLTRKSTDWVVVSVVEEHAGGFAVTLEPLADVVAHGRDLPSDGEG
jgi:hypothetical protein